MLWELCSRLCRFANVDTPHGRHLNIIVAAVFLDMLAVSFFVPLLPFYWRSLGVRPELLGFVSSVYQLSQIVSGVIMGYVGDHVLGRKGVLLLSFVGSAVSYSLAALSFRSGAVWGVVLSRMIVGLVKQTMTISKAAITSMTAEDERISVLSHLRAVRRHITLNHRPRTPTSFLLGLASTMSISHRWCLPRGEKKPGTLHPAP